MCEEKQKYISKFSRKNYLPFPESTPNQKNLKKLRLKLNLQVKDNQNSTYTPRNEESSTLM